MSPPQDYRNGILWRVEDLDKRVTRIEGLSLEVMKVEIQNLRQEIKDAREETKSLKRSFYTWCFGTVGSAIAFGISALALIGRI